MDKDLARVIATAGVHASRELGNLVPMLAESLPDQKELRLGFAAVIYEIHEKIIGPAFEACPELEAEFEARMTKYDRAT